MKFDIEILKVENGYIFTLNGKDYVCKNEREIARRLLVAFNPEYFPVYSRSEHNKHITAGMKEFWKDKVGKVEARILEEFKTEKILSASKLTNELFPEYYKGNPEMKKYAVHSMITRALVGLVKRGFVRRLSSQSKKYELVVK